MGNSLSEWVRDATWKNYLAAVILVTFVIGGFGGICLMILVSMGVEGLFWVLAATTFCIALTVSLVWSAANIDPPA